MKPVARERELPGLPPLRDAGGAGIPRDHRRFFRLARAAYPVALGVHALLVVVFALMGEWVLTGWNLLSVGVFAWAIHSHNRGHYRRPGIPVFAEMLGHAVLCVVILGTAPGFQLYLLTNVMIPFLVPFWGTGRKVLTAGAFALVLAGLEVYGLFVPPLSVHPDPLLAVFLAGNVLGIALVLIAVVGGYEAAVIEAEAALERAWASAEELLLNILPERVATRLKSRPGTVADHYPEATVLFADLVGFTRLAGSLPAEEVVELLNRIFSAFDTRVGQVGLEKIKTIGDAYMVVAGVPEARSDHVEAAAELALALRDELYRVAREAGFPELDLRIGIHTGEVVAGVIGTRRFAYDLWGDAVNTAARMESHGLPGEVHVSDAVRRRLPDRFRLRSRGGIEVKGKGVMETWILESH